VRKLHGTQASRVNLVQRKWRLKIEVKKKLLSKTLNQWVGSHHTHNHSDLKRGERDCCKNSAGKIGDSESDEFDRPRA
jgi:hypothetical protein